MLCQHTWDECVKPEYWYCSRCGSYKSKVTFDLDKLYDLDYWATKHDSLWKQAWNVDMHIENGCSKNKFVLDRIATERNAALEIGCAPGRLLYWLTWTGSFKEVVGIDPADPALIREIGSFKGQLYSGLFPEAASGLPDDKFDYIAGTDVFEHTPYPMDFLRRCYKLLKREGQLFLMLPMSDGISMESKHFLAEEHAYLHSKFNMSNMLKDVGFSDIVFDRWCVGHETVSARKW